MANKTKATSQKEEARDKGPETSDAPLPLLDLSDAAVKKMIKQAKKRGYVTYEQLNAVMPSEEVTSEQIEDILAMLNEMGINVVETEADEAEEEEPREEEDEEIESAELVEVIPKTLAKSKPEEPVERTDDPVRMYLREMGSIGLLSRQGEVAIAKRIEAGLEAMIAGLCESPLTFQAVIIWRDELNDGKVSLHDIIDLEATYAGPDVKAVSAAMPGADASSGLLMETCPSTHRSHQTFSKCRPVCADVILTEMELLVYFLGPHRRSVRPGKHSTHGAVLKQLFGQQRMRAIRALPPNKQLSRSPNMLCGPQTLSVLIGGGNHLTSAHNDRAAMLCP
jgi:RNA polymerase primary sigma factor